VFILQCFLGASLAEFVSAYPVEGGMYHWIAAIAPKRFNSILSFATGWSTVFGCKHYLRYTWTELWLNRLCRDIYNSVNESDLRNQLHGLDRHLQDRPCVAAVDDLCGVPGAQSSDIGDCHVWQSLYPSD
jgi:hypothetical protein